jgi:acetylornithine deacetylase/succinyl-diaminopimelate desuccinylase family protein
MTLARVDIAPHVDRDRLVERLQRLVQTPSENPPGNEADAARLVRSYCEEIGLETQEHELEPGRPSVVARWRGGDGPTLTYCSHIDVVPVGDPGLWDRHPFSGDIEGGRLYGRGSGDAKGPVAAALEAVAALRAAHAKFDGTLELALVADEETMGFKGAGFLVEEGIVRPDIGIVGEPTRLRVVHAQRGAAWFQIKTRGVAGHGSAPERGVSAVRHMAEIILRLDETLPDITHPVLGGPSINVGTIHGGEKVNIVPAGCVIEVDRRSLPEESAEDLEKSLSHAIELARERFPDIDAEIELAFYGEPFEVPVDAPVVRAAADAASEVLGRDAELIGFRGASDARFLSEAGADVVVWGPGEIELAHTARESVSLDEVEQCAHAYALAFARLLGA